VRSVSNGNGQLEDRYEYDAFGKPYAGDLDNGMNLGYMGKPYDSNTGLYNYGYRDYKPEAARFTTVDPIRDGSNWFVYVNSDPVNYTDLWGLEYRWMQTQSQTRNNVTISGPYVVEISEDTYERSDEAYNAAVRDTGNRPSSTRDNVISVEERNGSFEYSTINEWSVFEPSLTKQTGIETEDDGSKYIVYQVRPDEETRPSTVLVSVNDWNSRDRIQNCGD
jgi:RHS repeat-associated protein